MRGRHGRRWRITSICCCSTRRIRKPIEIVGTYYCLVKQRWEDGLPLLARAADPRLTELAESELKLPATPAEQVALADRWWTFAEGDTKHKLAVRRRSAYWYRQALSGLPPGLERIKAESRLARAESKTEPSGRRKPRRMDFPIRPSLRTTRRAAASFRSTFESARLVVAFFLAILFVGRTTGQVEHKKAVTSHAHSKDESSLMTTRQAMCQGTLVVCQCGNRFLVPKRQGGERVTCTLCGASVPVPASRSVHQAAADALGANGQKNLWKELAALEKEAEPSPRKRLIKRPVEEDPKPSDPRRRTWIAIGVISVVAIVFVAVGGAALYRHWAALQAWSQDAYTSQAGGFQVRLPPGITGRYFCQRRGTHPRLKYTFEGVGFADGTCVGVAYMDLFDDEPMTDLPEGIVAYLEREYHGEVSVAEQCKIRLGSHPGRQVTYEQGAGSQRKSYSRWFLVGNRLYDVTWIAGYRQPAIPAVCQFLDSFQLLAEPTAEVTSSGREAPGAGNPRR